MLWTARELVGEGDQVGRGRERVTGGRVATVWFLSESATSMWEDVEGGQADSMARCGWFC